MWRRELATIFLRLFRPDKKGAPGGLAPGQSRI
jgi:hypothetical protein